MTPAPRAISIMALPVALSFAVSACAAPVVPNVTGNTEVDAFLADIAAKRRDPAVARIASIESLTGRPNAVQTPAAFVDKLLTCSFVRSDPVQRLGMFKLSWDCPDGKYLALLDPGFRAPRLTVGQFVPTATMEAWSKEMPRPAPPPVTRPTPAAAQRFVAAVEAGKDLAASEFAGVLRPGDTAKFNALKGCRGMALAGEDSARVLALWTCTGETRAHADGVVLVLSDGKVVSLQPSQSFFQFKGKAQ